MPAKRKTSPKGAVAEAAGEAAGLYLREQREAAEAAAAVAEAAATVTGKAPAKRRGGADPLVGELRHELLPLLVLHFMSQGPTYGNQLIDRVTELTGGVLTVNPNTMYPLLRDFEKRELIEGQWEHPERRSRRFYSLTKAGEKELTRLRGSARTALDQLAETVGRLKAELFEG